MQQPIGSSATNNDRDVYDHPLSTRYASACMSRIWSPRTKFTTWRQLWVALATAQRALGLEISQEQIDAMTRKIHDIDFEFAEAKEKELRHDVMSHIHAFAKEAPEAQKIIHLGATSCFVTDNGELIQMRASLRLIRQRLVKLMKVLSQVAEKYRHLPTLGFTHYQPAQLTTVGKRACLWLQDFLMDLHEIHRIYQDLPFRGVKGTTGTQASFLELFDGDHARVKKLDEQVTALMGFKCSLPICGQTYTRKIDYQIMCALCGIGQSAHKMCTDIRLLANLKEIEEPFGSKQVGSSAMAYKRNPMRSERACSISRYLMNLTQNASQTHSVQWFERTLDDSANRRMVLPEAFLAADGVITLCTDITDGLQVWPLVIRKHVMAELPFMATENILMASVKAGGDRQLLHEAIREHSMAAGRRVKEEVADNDLLERIGKDPRFSAIHLQLSTILDPAKFVGRAPEQVTEFLSTQVHPLLAVHQAALSELDAQDAVGKGSKVEV